MAVATVTRVTFGPQARWSEDLKESSGAESRELPHVALVLEGRFHVVMDDGTEDEFGPNDVMLLPPGHDALLRRADVGANECGATRRTGPEVSEDARARRDLWTG